MGLRETGKRSEPRGRGAGKCVCGVMNRGNLAGVLGSRFSWLRRGNAGAFTGGDLLRMAFNLKKVLKALLLSSNQPLAIKDIQAVFTRFHEQMTLPLPGVKVQFAPVGTTERSVTPRMAPVQTALVIRATRRCASCWKR